MPEQIQLLIVLGYFTGLGFINIFNIFNIFHLVQIFQYFFNIFRYPSILRTF